MAALVFVQDSCKHRWRVEVRNTIALNWSQVSELNSKHVQCDNHILEPSKLTSAAVLRFPMLDKHPQQDSSNVKWSNIQPMVRNRNIVTIFLWAN